MLYSASIGGHWFLKYHSSFFNCVAGGSLKWRLSTALGFYVCNLRREHVAMAKNYFNNKLAQIIANDKRTLAITQGTTRTKSDCKTDDNHVK